MKRLNRSFIITLRFKRRIGPIVKQTGAGVHLDKRTKRNRTRMNQNNKSINESKEE